DFLPRKMKYRRLFCNLSPNKYAYVPNSLLLILGKRVVAKVIVVKSGIILVSERQPRQTVRKSPSGWERRFGIMLFKKSHYKAKLSKNTGIEKLSCPPRTK